MYYPMSSTYPRQQPRQTGLTVPDEVEPSPDRLENVNTSNPAQMGCIPDPKALSSGRDPVTPSPKRPSLDPDAIRPAADLPTMSSARIHAQPVLLRSPIPHGTSRAPSITVTDWDTNSRRNAAARILTLQLIRCVDNDDKLRDEVAYWYQEFRFQMWSPLASMIGIHWRQVEQFCWQMGKEEIVQRATKRV
ncbi:hypothetical protein ASPBRDRAFT_201487 [Aspergillus brasiliensis CBS 101740]|uniref:Uncharacterized protein n=1 Tax=Aspergillus brasiliensis (strain CBS 101740 / IMI 381727 / IBT 21946) TaxID=767769 RepID=A0A1L9U1T1_ASPBC|nr:hypothetical protein ASPBRDRAFT_201756 [Aspergillus brasiliensis CBS 101740]OJJ65815.1 hypothetical protein ASPBRDRAFT_201487 [Aspergillus brasiliensis CBS 101740]